MQKIKQLRIRIQDIKNVKKDSHKLHT